MNLAQQSYEDLHGKPLNKEFVLNYSGKFRGYNANIKMDSRAVTVNMSKKWRTVSPDIQKGCIQELMVRLFNLKTESIHIDLYHTFIKTLPKVVPKTETHPVLEESFQRINEHFFGGMMDQPNLKLGNGINRLGTYEYSTDTVAISKILLDDMRLLDYVMYHELLHKKHQYTAKGKRTTHHSRAFKRDEAKFPGADFLEKELERLVRKKKRFSLFW